MIEDRSCALWFYQVTAAPSAASASAWRGEDVRAVATELERRLVGNWGAEVAGRVEVVGSLARRSGGSMKRAAVPSAVYALTVRCAGDEGRVGGVVADGRCCAGEFLLYAASGGGDGYEVVASRTALLPFIHVVLASGGSTRESTAAPYEHRSGRYARGRAYRVALPTAAGALGHHDHDHHHHHHHYRCRTDESDGSAVCPRRSVLVRILTVHEGRSEVAPATSCLLEVECGVYGQLATGDDWMSEATARPSVSAATPAEQVPGSAWLSRFVKQLTAAPHALTCRPLSSRLAESARQRWSEDAEPTVWSVDGTRTAMSHCWRERAAYYRSALFPT
ncbi:hypothetical protein CDCA_CDCA20G4816 [Cyanidium caldarium]|uniref:Uncharacterized protein n=1 Tax=Cyanidium caldarium TaxID=2771 RepID=A0AAV9J333_CYACA|nr:hypothetical protein CDCA_CDCA20G4816 [Cyanidium caldarium]